jgi:hypothetical protein
MDVGSNRHYRKYHGHGGHLQTTPIRPVGEPGVKPHPVASGSDSDGSRPF